MTIRKIMNNKAAIITLSLLFLGVTISPQYALAGRGGVRHGGGHHGGGHPHHGGGHHHHGHMHGHMWHPVGFFITVLAVTAIVVSVNDQQYHYDQGVYYQEGTDDQGTQGYVAVPAPIGAKVPSLPDGYETAQAGSNSYYYYGGVFYTGDTDGEYVVVQGPVGAVVSSLPDGAKEEYYSEVLYYNYNGIYFQPKSVNGDTQFEVVQHP